MRLKCMKYLYALLGVLFIIPSLASAATNFEISGWLPYWRGATSTADVLPHLNEITEVHPFVYTIKSDGTIADNGPMDQDPWKSFDAAAKAQNVRVVPTVMTGSGDLLHEILSNATKRVALEDAIAKLVKDNNFDGVDIDFEGKHAEDKDNFSTFLKGLYQRMGTKLVECSIESRTPVDSRYYGTTVPPDAEIYANDLVQINKYCDRVMVMAYDQQGIDLQLAAQAASSSQLYAPVADPAWVTKVINLMKQSISPSKILIGVPTYGYEYDVTAYANNEYTYDIMWTFNPLYGTQTAAQYGVTPERNSAGEMYFTYVPTTASSTMPISANIAANIAAAAASLYATQYNSHLDFRLVDWPDATSIAQKVTLAKQLGVRGIAIFKMDGGEDPNMWNAIAGAKGASTAGGTVGSGNMSALARNLSLGSTGTDVQTVQKILNTDTATQVSTSGAGSPGHETTTFGSATVAAIKKFQVKWGIAKAGQAGYGTVGPATRAKLNTILAGM